MQASSSLELRRRIVELARATLGQGGPEPWAREAGVRLGPNDDPEWCGLWVRAIWRRSGLRVPDWVIGAGNVAYLRQRPRHELAKPGDMSLLKGRTGHQAIVIEDDGEMVRTIDGNSTGGKVVEKPPTPREQFAAFYAIDGIVPEPPPPAPEPREHDDDEPHPGPDEAHGIDVSHHQRTVDWLEAYRAGISFVYVRATYGTTVDQRAVTHAGRARHAGLAVGLYHFARPDQDVAAQVDAFADVAKELGMGVGWLLPAIDVEAYPLGGVSQPPVPAWNPACEALAAAFAERWGSCLVYLSAGDWGRLGRPSWPLQYPLWVPHWWPDDSPGRWPPVRNPLTPGDRPWSIHQYGVGPGFAWGGRQATAAVGALDHNRARQLHRIQRRESHVPTLPGPPPVVPFGDTVRAAVDGAVAIALGRRQRDDDRREE